MSELPVRSVAVVGQGPTAWLAAIALHRAFAPTGVRVAIVATPSEAQPQDAIAALPDLAGFHRLLGISEAELLREADAAWSLGRQFVGWSGDGPEFLHAYGDTGAPLEGMPFVQLWTKARSHGLPVTFEQFSLAAVAARHGRIATPDTSMGSARAGYHLDARGYEALLARTARDNGVMVLNDSAPQAEIIDGRIVALRLADGRAVQADLFVDATGGSARLINALDPDAGTSSDACDRMLSATRATMSPIPLHGRVAAHRAGWTSIAPLASRTAVTLAWSSAHLRDEEALALLQTQLRISGDVVAGTIEHRLRARPWVANCVAIGAAAFSGEPLDAAELLRDQIGIAQLLALFPVHRENMLEASIYNEEAVGHYQRLRDVTAAHYRLNRRAGEPFWDAAREAPVSEDLAWKIALFAERGMIAQYNQESFSSDSWEALLIGHGVIPRSWDPQLDAVADDRVAHGLQATLGAIKTQVSAMVSHAEARAAALA